MRGTANNTSKLNGSSFTRITFLVLLLACFVGLQTASAVEIHPHQHGGLHSHCCVACHAGHFPATQAVLRILVSPAQCTGWHSQSEHRHMTGDGVGIFRCSRAPPTSVFSPLLSYS